MNKKLPTWVAVGAVGVCSALLATGVNGATKDQIARQADAAEKAACFSVMQGAQSFEPLEIKDSRYTIDAIYSALNASGEKVGFAGKTTVSGYGGPVEITAGVDGEGRITGVDVGGAGFNETPGLGSLTQQKKYTDQFIGKTAGVSLSDEGVDGISGATISSNAVAGGINNIVSYVSAAELGILEEKEEAYMGSTVSQVEKGFAGDVTVTVGFNEDQTIAYLDIQTPDETEGLGKLASEPAFTGQFIGKKGPFTYGEDGIEAISGATFTSTAVINALNTIAEGGGTASEGPLSKTVQGFGGDVTVNVKLNPDNSVAALTIDTPNETDGLGKRASEPDFTGQFVGKYAPFAYGEDGIEALTGATVTSTAVIDALNELVPASEAEVKPAENEAPVEEMPAATEAPVETAADIPASTEAPAKATAESDLFRIRPEAVALEGNEAPAADAVVASTIDDLFRPRPDAAALEGYQAPAADTAETSTVDDLFRPRPDGAALEGSEAPVSDAGETAVTSDDLFRPRPDAAALEGYESPVSEAEKTEVVSVEDIFRKAPDADALKQAEVSKEAKANDASTVTREDLFRARPALAAESPEAAPVNAGNADRLMRPRPDDSAFPDEDTAGIDLAVGLDDLQKSISETVDIRKALHS